MGRKVNPIGFRLGIVSDWESKWFAERNYTEQLHEDIKIRKLVMKELTTRRHLHGSSLSAPPIRSMSRCTRPSRASSSASRAPMSSVIRQHAREGSGQEGSSEDRRDQGA